MKLIAGSNHSLLARQVSGKLDIHFERISVKRFKDNEIEVHFNTCVKDEDIYVFQSLSNPFNDYFVELLMLVDRLKQKGARRIIGIIPYFGYARSSSGFDLITELLESVGLSQIIAIGLHDPKMKTFLKIPIRNLDVVDLFGKDIQKRSHGFMPLIVAPDKGAEKRARDLAHYLKSDFALLHKERCADGSLKSIKISGEIQGRNCVIVDDIVDSGSTLISAAATLKKLGALDIKAYVIHAVGGEECIKSLKQSGVSDLTVTDTINKGKLAEIKVLGVGEILSEAIKNN